MVDAYERMNSTLLQLAEAERRLFEDFDHEAAALVGLFKRSSGTDLVDALVRLFFYAAAQSLTVRETEAADGRPKRHNLLMLMDEFPLLGS